MSDLMPDQVSLLEAKIQRRLGTRIKNLRLAIHECGLVLHGMAWSYYAKQLAQHTIMEASNVPIAANKIEVCPLQESKPVDLGVGSAIFF